MPKLYHSLPSIDEESLDGSGEKQRQTRQLLEGDGFVPRAIDKISSHWTWLAHACLLSISMTLLTLSFCARGTGTPSDLAYTEKYSSYSPVAPTVKYHTERYNLTPIVEGPYVGFGDEVDKAWSRIADNMGDIWISDEEVDRLGLPKNSLRITHPKTGKVGYRGAVEVFHQLHCLNLIRQAIYKDYYRDQGGDLDESQEKEDIQGHVDHCIETMRMNLMCQSDIGIFTFRLYPEYGYADDDYWPDFSTEHVCRNFEDVLKWGMDNTIAWDHSV